MITTFPQLTVTLPLTSSTRDTAAQFAQQQPTSEKAEQVHLNTLAVCAVNDYCQMLGINANLTAGDSWHPLKRLAANLADLELVDVGRLECRPVGLNDAMCRIPPEVWADRIGYVAVQIDLQNLEATLLGFVPTATAEHLPLTQFGSLDDLIDQVHARQQTAPSHTSINLEQWLLGQVSAGWQTIEALLKSLNAEPAFAFRSALAETDANSERLQRGKLIHFSTATVDYPLALVVEVVSRPDQRRSVYVQIHTIEAGTFLPEGLRLVGLDQNGTVVLETQARQADDYVQLRLRGTPGELLRLRIELQDTTLSEDFVI
jgi:hypothetical protein